MSPKNVYYAYYENAFFKKVQSNPVLNPLNTV